MLTPVYHGENGVRTLWNRLIMTFDELNQYTNQVINNYRQNPRSVKVEAFSEGATDVTALKRAGMIREIEYKSKAQQRLGDHVRTR